MEHTYEKEYTIRARNLSLVSQTSPIPPTATSITISSLGGGDLLQNGNVAVNATGNIMMQAGSAVIGMEAHTIGSSIAIANGTPGTITIDQGQVPGSPQIKMTGLPPALNMSVGVPLAGSAVSMEATGMKLSFGPPVGGASIELGPTGLVLKYALWTLELGATGIDLKVGPNSVSIQPKGISINGVSVDVAAMTMMKMEGLKITESAGVNYQAKAAITMIG